MMREFTEGRAWLRADGWRKRGSLETAQRAGEPEPAPQKDWAGSGDSMVLPSPEHGMTDVSVADALGRRRSKRSFVEDRALSLEQLSFLLWSVQGVSGSDLRMRTSPSGGARHPFETYLAVRRVDGLEPGLYGYDVASHAVHLLQPRSADDLRHRLSEGCLGQAFVGQAPVCFLWAARPERSEWRYGPLAHKLIALDAGHVCQNLYLAVEALGAGTCGIGAYDQELLDELLDLDGQDEFVIYAAPVGFVRSR